jgi:hypothetical protein
MTRSRLWPLLVTPTLLLTLAACGGNDDKSSELPTTPPSSSNTPSTPPSSTVPPSATPTAAPTRIVGKYGDLTLELTRPAKVDAKAEVGVARFWAVHQAFATMLSGGKTPASLSSIATGDVVKTLDALLASQRQAKEHSGGSLTVRATVAMASQNIAVVDGCFDQRKLLTIRPDGTRYVDPTVKQGPIKHVRVTVSATAGRWMVSEYSLKGSTC